MVHRAFLAILLAFTQPLLAATALIPLQYRSAEELLPVAQTLLAEGESLAAHQQHLLVRASLERINELRGILAQLDVPARQLLISLDPSVEQPYPEYRVIGQHMPRPHPPRLITAGHSTALRIRASEGWPALINLAHHEPVLGLVTDLDGKPYFQHQESQRGIALQVIARLQGDQVQLDLTVQRSEPDPGRYGSDIRLLGETRLTGRLGEWINLSGRPHSSARKLAATSPTDAQPLRVRVDLLD